MNRWGKYLLLVVSYLVSHHTFSQIAIQSFDELLVLAEKNSTTIRSDEFRLRQAEKARSAAVANVIDLTGSVSLNVTNNTELPVSLFPAEAFGGTPGTYREVQTGIQHTNNFNQYVELKLINPGAWKSLTRANVQIEATQVDNQRSRKSLYESLASGYYNILGLQSQYQYAAAAEAASDTILQLTRYKFQAGLVRQQDLNDAEVNAHNARESKRQIAFLLQQEYLSLKILADIPENEEVSIDETVESSTASGTPEIDEDRLTVSWARMNEKSARATYRQYQIQLLPTLSAFASNSYQQFSSQFSLFDSQVSWINSNYIGLKLNWVIPTASSISQIHQSRYDYLISSETTRHAIHEADAARKQLWVAHDKAVSQSLTDEAIVKLQNESYMNNLASYREGVASLEDLLRSYSNLVNSQYQLASSRANALLAQARIHINNKIQ
jgi:outer membrane protein TolC